MYLAWILMEEVPESDSQTEMLARIHWVDDVASEQWLLA